MSANQPDRTMLPADCLLCRKHRGDFIVPGGAIYVDELVYASHAHLPQDGLEQYLGWVTIETQRHIPELGDMTDREAERFGRLVARSGRAILAATEAEHVYAFVIGHGIPHLHLHLIPRYPGTPRQYWGQRIDEWPDAPRGDAARIEALCDRIRALLDR